MKGEWKPKRTRKDVNQRAFDVVRRATDEDRDEDQDQDEPKKNEAAVALGRLGGLKGGKARAAKLSPARRREIARKAAAARWKKD